MRAIASSAPGRRHVGELLLEAMLEQVPELQVQLVAIVLEISLFPLYSGAPSFDELYRFLTSECGLVYRGRIDQWVSPRDRRILQIDCLFEKQDFVKSSG